MGQFDLRSDGTREFEDRTIWRDRPEQKTTKRVLRARKIGTAQAWFSKKRRINEQKRDDKTVKQNEDSLEEGVSMPTSPKSRCKNIWS